MGIISANRLSKMNGNFIIAANENYGVNDIGRIMLENERNDMAIFNAAVKSDMYAIKCRTEGTLLESEIQSLNENAIKDFFNKIIEKLKKFWAKMKGVFKKAYALITAYCIHNGKAFVNANRAAINKLSSSQVIKGKAWYPVTEDRLDVKILEVKDFVAIAKSGVKGSLSASEMTEKAIKKSYPDYTEGNLFNFLKERMFVEKEDGKLGDWGEPKQLATYIESGSDAVKELKKEEKKLESAIKSSIKELETKARNAAVDIKDEQEKKAKEEEANAYNKAATATVNASSTMSSAEIKILKFSLAQARHILGRAIAGSVKTESTLMESMLLEAAEEIEDMDDSDAESLTPEEAEEAAAIIAQAAEELGGSDDTIEDSTDEGCKSC